MTDILLRKNISLKSFKKILYGYISRSLLESMYSISSLYFHFPFIIIYLQIVSNTYSFQKGFLLSLSCFL